MEPEDNRPRFEHDCESCVYLGRFDIAAHPWDGLYDLYYCPQAGLPTVIARYGNEGWEYYSGVGFRSIEPLIEAERRARERRLPLKPC